MEASWWERLTEGETGSCSDGCAMLSKSLIQLSVDGRGCVPSLLFHLRPLPLFIFYSLCHLNSLSWLKNSFHMSSGSEVKASAHNVGDLGSIPGLEDPLEKEVATHSSILSWRIPWMEESGGLQSMGSQRVGHD